LLSAEEWSRTSVLEVLLRELLEGALVKVVLKVLEGESELQDSHVDVGVLARNEGGCSGDGGQDWCGAENGRPHCE
jgi:hypothetical protein